MEKITFEMFLFSRSVVMSRATFVFLNNIHVVYRDRERMSE